MKPPNKEGFEVYRNFPVIKFACSSFYKFSQRDFYRPCVVLNNGKSKSHASSTKFSKYEVLSPHRPPAIGGTSIKFSDRHLGRERSKRPPRLERV